MKMKVVLSGLLAVLLSVGGFLFSMQFTKTKSSESWEKIVDESNLSHTIPLVPIKFFNKNNGIAVRGLTIQKTDDGGSNWDKVYYEEENGVYAGIFTNETEGWVVGTENLEKPLVLRTNDKGISWRKINFDEKSLEALKGKFTYFRDICFDTKGKTWIIGNGGIVQVDTYGQELKLVSLFPTKEGLYRVSCNDSGEIWAVGIRNSVFHFRYGWVKNDLNEKYWFSNIKSIETDVWLIGQDDSDKGVLLKSQDNGQTWENKTPESAKTLNDLYLKDGKGWLVGAEGSIYYSSDNGNSWTKSESPTKADLLHIFSLDTNNVWISGDRATILKYQN